MEGMASILDIRRQAAWLEDIEDQGADGSIRSHAFSPNFVDLVDVYVSR